MPVFAAVALLKAVHVGVTCLAIKLLGGVVLTLVVRRELRDSEILGSLADSVHIVLRECAGAFVEIAGFGLETASVGVVVYIGEGVVLVFEVTTILVLLSNVG